MRVMLVLSALTCAGIWVVANTRSSARKEERRTDAVSGERAAPGIVARQHDFGIGRPQAVLRHTFRFVNSSAAPVHVRGIRTTCRCTDAAIDRREIGVGQSASLTIEYHAASGQGVDEQRITLTGDSDSAPLATFRVTAIVRPELFVTPRHLQLADDGDGRRWSGHFTVMNFSDCDWSELTCEPEHEWLVAATSPASPDLEKSDVRARQTWVVRLTLIRDTAHDAPLGQRLQVVGRCDDRFFRETVHASVPLRPRVRTVPSVVFFRDLVPGAPATTKIEFVLAENARREGLQASLFTSECRIPLAHEWITDPAGRCWLLITARPDTESHPGTVSGQVVIDASASDLPQLILPVRGWVQ